MTVTKLKPKHPEPPGYLDAVERLLWERLISEFAIDDSGGLVLLEQLCRSLQLVRRCREEIATAGLMPDGKAHPLLAPLRDAEKQASTALRQLGLNSEPVRPVGRPPSPIGWRHD
jgi:hypothetical protein